MKALPITAVLVALLLAGGVSAMADGVDTSAPVTSKSGIPVPPVALGKTSKPGDKPCEKSTPACNAATIAVAEDTGRLLVPPVPPAPTVVEENPSTNRWIMLTRQNIALILLFSGLLAALGVMRRKTSSQ